MWDSYPRPPGVLDVFDSGTTLPARKGLEWERTLA